MTPTSSFCIICLCGAISEAGTSICDQEAPVNVDLCHCNTCRYTTGSLAVSFLLLNSSPSPATLERLASYRSSHTATRYFCPTCGCYCFYRDIQREKWYCLSGIVEQNTYTLARTENVTGVMHHIYVPDTVDGGLAPFLLQLGDRSIPTWATSPPDLALQEQFDLSHATVLSMPSSYSGSYSQPGPDSYLPAKCHCGGVDLLIKRANHTGKASRSCNHPDLTKYPAYLCACRSCRLSTGTSLVPWTLVYPENVFNGKLVSGSDPVPDDRTQVTFGFAEKDLNANLGLSLRNYWSSPNTCRSFCHNCGATVSYWCDQRPDELDIAVGILRSEEGSMARRWLGWIWGRCCFAEESIERELCDTWQRSAERMIDVEK